MRRSRKRPIEKTACAVASTRLSSSNLRGERRGRKTRSQAVNPRAVHPKEMAKSDALQAILAAISTGVPLYNRGDALGCLETYETVATRLVTTPDALPHGGASKLQQALAAAAHGSPTERAWTMRHGLDEVLLLLRGGGASANDAPSGASVASSSAVVDFGDHALRWTTVDDRVMGGSSRSRMTVDGGTMVFEGELVTAGGGFASVRCMLPERPPQLRGAVALRLTCAGDGRRGYKLVVKTDAALDGVSYQHGFAAPVGPAQTVRLPLAAFTPTFRGSAAPNAPPLRGEDIVQVGLMLSRYGGGGGVDTSVEPGGFQLRLLALEAE